MRRAASGDSFALLRTNDQASLKHVGNNGYASGAFKDFFGNPLIGSRKDFMQHLSCVVHSIDGILAGCTGPRHVTHT